MHQPESNKSGKGVKFLNSLKLWAFRELRAPHVLQLHAPTVANEGMASEEGICEKLKAFYLYRFAPEPYPA